MALAAQPTYALQPSATKVMLPSNYISLFDFSNQYAPDVYKQLANIYGNQSITGLLSMLGQESSFASDVHIWTEEGRLHVTYTDVARADNVFTKADHVFRKNETIYVSDANGTAQGIVIAVDKDTFTMAPYKAGGFDALATTGLKVFAYGSEFKKGTPGMEGSLESDLSIYRNKPIILKEHYETSGSDATQIGWVEVEEGFLWYLKSEADTRRRWEDKLELAMLLGQTSDTGSGASVAGYGGTEGFIEAVSKRGNIYQGIATDVADWDEILKRFDAQGKIQDYMFYVNRDQSIAIDNMLGKLNAFGDNGISYGIFNNSKDMAVNLGFRGFTRGTYNFFKTDYKLLNDSTLLGGVAGAGKINGFLIPVGTKEVYEGEYNGNGNGKKVTTPFLQQMYRQAGIENRKYKTWVTGTVGNVKTNSNDSMEVHHLSERMLNTVGANNFMIFKGA